MSVQILQGEARELLRDMPAAQFDCIIADPPYAETSLAWDKWPEGWPVDALRVLKPGGSMWVFGSLRMFLKYGGDFNGWSLAQELIWEKQNGTGAHADRFRRVHEQMVQFYPSKSPWSAVYRKQLTSNDAIARKVIRRQRPQHWGNLDGSVFETTTGGPRMLRSVLCHRNEHGRAVHPTQKPVPVVEVLLAYSCPPGGTVLDLFAGSGTTAMAARNLGMNSVSIEGAPETVAVLTERLAQPEDIFA